MKGPNVAFVALVAFLVGGLAGPLWAMAAGAALLSLQDYR